MVDDTLKRFGGIDAFGNVAGVVYMKSADTVVDLTDEGCDYVIDTERKADVPGRGVRVTD